MHSFGFDCSQLLSSNDPHDLAEVRLEEFHSSDTIDGQQLVNDTDVSCDNFRGLVLKTKQNLHFDDVRFVLIYLVDYLYC